MKKLMSCLLVIAVVVSMMAAAGCAKKVVEPPVAPTPVPVKKELPKAVVFAVMEPGTTTHTLGTAMARMIDKYLGIKVTVQTVASSLIWTKQIKDREADLAFVSYRDLYCGARGLEEFAKVGPTPIRCLANAYTHRITFFSRADTGIKSISDLRGKKVVIDYPATPVMLMWSKHILEAYGMTTDDVIAVSAAKLGDGQTMLREKRVDAIVHPFIPVLEELIRAIGLTYFDIPRDKVMSIIEKYPFYGFAVFPKGLYGVDRDVPCLANPAPVFVHKDMDEELAYKWVKTIFDNWDEFAAIHTLCRDMSLEFAVKFAPPAPFHPGAIRYYKEKGVWTPELEGNQKKQLADLAKYEK